MKQKKSQQSKETDHRIYKDGYERLLHMLHVVKDVSFLSHVTFPSRETNFLQMKQATDMKNQLYAQLIQLKRLSEEM